MPTLRKCGIIRGDFGLSMVRRSIYVNDYIRDGLPATLKYAVPSLLFALLRPPCRNTLPDLAAAPLMTLCCDRQEHSLP